jgi:hypothetical protein
VLSRRRMFGAIAATCQDTIPSRRSAVVVLLLCCASLSPSVRATAQPTEPPERDTRPPVAWLLVGADVIDDRWRGTVRVGHLGDIDSRILITDLTFVARPELHVLVSHVYLAPASPEAAAVSLARTGASWLPLRRRVTVETRWLLERLHAFGAGSNLRGRNRIRASWARPPGLPASVVGSIETIATRNVGIVENRIQLGLSRSFGALSLEGYWLRRRLRARPDVEGVGITFAWRADL